MFWVKFGTKCVNWFRFLLLNTLIITTKSGKFSRVCFSTHLNQLQSAESSGATRAKSLSLKKPEKILQKP
ncbi:hypothetical protein HMPREF1582_01393 [Gardnerella vaginalis JCP8151A]|nr:hypothetical protein HMPREF1582_01393 [Gardnerella vaginalis JCP8151A]